MKEKEYTISEDDSMAAECSGAGEEVNHKLIL